MTMSPKFRVLTGNAPIQIGRAMANPVAGEWGTTPTVIKLAAQDQMPTDQLGRIAFHSTHTLGGSVITNADGTARYSTSTRLLTPEQLHLIYQRTPDVRAAFDQIARVVSTWDWQIDVCGIEPDEDEYEAALEVAEAVRQFLLIPNANDWTWQEVLVAWVTDLLKFDNGPIELVKNRKGMLEELVPVRGGDIQEVVDEHGRLLRYKQVQSGNITATSAQEVFIDTDDMLLLQLFRTTEGPGGLPLLESLIHEIISVLRVAEYIASSVDLNEIPPGLLVITGVADAALQRFKAETEADRNQDWKLRILHSPGRSLGPVDAKWVQFQRAPREQQLAELLMEIRRTIWRVLGVTPVTMGDTSETPRATAEVQLDASHSHMIGPILELLQAKINAKILPYLVPDEYAGVLEFKFKMERELTEAERLSRAERLAVLVRNGIYSINEARQEIGFDPVDDGDELIVFVGKDGATVLSRLLEEPEEVDLAVDPAADPNEVPDSPSDAGEGSELSRRPRRRSRRPARMRRARWTTRRDAKRARQRAVRALAIERSLRTPTGLHYHHRGEADLPSEWQDSARFKDARVIDLQKLGQEIVGYAGDVLPLWEQARTEAISSVASHYRQEGFGSDERQQIVTDLARAMEKLVTDWVVSTAGRYTAAADIARNATANWISNPISTERARQLGDSYRQSATAYLVQQEGPVHNVERAVHDILNRVGDLRDVPARDLRVRARGPKLGINADPAEVLRAVGEIFDAQRHRIANWSGKLVDLAYQVVHASLREGYDAERAGEDWYVQWANAADGDRICPTCRREGDAPLRPLSQLTTRPGGATECGARCRCVLVYWTREEVENGTAARRSGQQPPPAPRAGRFKPFSGTPAI